jgi:N-acyl-D-amino-acid deacylase
VVGERIVAIGDLDGADARTILVCAGRVVAPGFIDVHTHSDFTRLLTPRAESLVLQGVTTEIVGNCGFSAAPWYGAAPALHGTFLRRYGLVPTWTDLEGYLLALERAGSSINCATLVGHNTIRAAVMGLDPRPATADELRRMVREVEAALDAGAVGLSSGLAYSPGNAADSDELIALAAVAARRDRLYTTHIRGEDVRLIEGVQEALDTARAAGPRTQLSHHPAKFPANGRSPETLGMVERARGAGLDVACDLHPYTAGATWMIQLLPPSAVARGVERLPQLLRDPGFRARMRAELMQATDLVAPIQLMRAGRWHDLKYEWGVGLPELIGRDFASLAAARKQEPFDVLFDIMAAQGDCLGDAVVTAWVYAESDIRAVLTYPSSLIGSDGYTLGASGPLGAWRFHPRSWGTFPRVLRRYVRDESILTLPEAVRKMTSASADRFGLRERGRLAAGFHADIVVFDLATVEDRATYESPNVPATGICHVLVNGTLVVRDGIHLGSTPGHALRRGR